MNIHELATQNENGENLCDFCQTNGLVITGTIFLHKDIHKATLVPANGRVKTQIDYLLINGQYRSSVLDTKVMRGADANSNQYKVKTGDRTTPFFRSKVQDWT